MKKIAPYPLLDDHMLYDFDQFDKLGIDEPLAEEPDRDNPMFIELVEILTKTHS